MDLELTGAGAIGGVAKITSELMNAYASFESARRSAVTAKTNRALNSANQRIRQASFDLERTRLERAGERTLSSITAGIAKSGFELSGSPLDVLMDSTKELELDLLTLEFNKQVSEYESMITDRQLEIDQMRAKTHAITGPINSLLGATADIAGNYAMAKLAQK